MSLLVGPTGPHKRPHGAARPRHTELHPASGYWREKFDDINLQRVCKSFQKFECWIFSTLFESRDIGAFRPCFQSKFTLCEASFGAEPLKITRNP